MDRRRGPSRGILSKVYVDVDANMRLHEACKSGNISTVTKMIRRKYAFDVNLKDSNSNSLLHHASKGGHSVIVQLLLDSGANVNAQNTCGTTPLHLAVQGNHCETVKRLIIAGASFDLLDTAKLAARDHAKCGSDVLRILTDAEAGVEPEVEEFPDKVTIPPHIIPCAIIEEEYRRKKEEELREKKAKAKKQGKK